MLIRFNWTDTLQRKGQYEDAEAPQIPSSLPEILGWNDSLSSSTWRATQQSPAVWHQGCWCALLLPSWPRTQNSSSCHREVSSFTLIILLTTKDRCSCTHLSSRADAARLIPRLSWKSGVRPRVTREKRIQNQSGRKDASPTDATLRTKIIIFRAASLWANSASNKCFKPEYKYTEKFDTLIATTYECLGWKCFSKLWFQLAWRTRVASTEPDISVQLTFLFPQLFQGKLIYLMSALTAGAAIRTRMARWK